MTRLPLLAGALLLAGLALGAASAAFSAPPAAPADPFLAFAPVLQSPRCMNCHTSVPFPRQGDDRHRHLFNVTRGTGDHGAAGLACATCHIDRNQRASGVPGAPHWGVAPMAMAWEGLSPAQICARLADKSANGNRDLGALVAHMTSDPLVQWGFAPGSDSNGRARSVPPISQADFHALVRQWAATGGRCPSRETSP